MWSQAAREAAALTRKAHNSKANLAKGPGRDSMVSAIKTVRALQKSGAITYGAKARLTAAKKYAKSLAELHGLKTPKFKKK